MSNNLLTRPRSMGSLLPPNYASDEGQFDLNLPRIRPAWLMNESIKSLDSKFPMVPAPTGSIMFYTTPLGEKLRQQPKNREFDLTDPLRPSLSYNYLHDEHLQSYFKSNEMRKRLQDEGFITSDGYVKCSLKEFNEYRQWIRKLKLDELSRERRQDEKKIEEARKERIERIALERDPELLEILKRRREKKREEAKLLEKRIKRERERLRKLEEIDRQRRENFLEGRRKTRDRILIKRDLERERLRLKKSDEERQQHKIKLRIVRKMNKDEEDRMKHLEERKKEAKELKVKKLEEQWLRRESWSVEHHEHLKETKEVETRQFQQHVEERSIRVARQRRWSQVSYNEIAEANRRAFENQLEKAEVFLAKLNHKKAEELKKWRKKFDAMQKSSHSTLGSKHSEVKQIKPRTRRQSAWDLESCLLKDLGMEEHEIKDNSYTKLGVISRGNELGLVGDTVGPLGSLPEEDDEGETHNKEFRFSIPTIVESFASLRSSSESDSDSDYSFHIPSVFRFESLHDLQPVSDSPEIKPNDGIPEGELRTLVHDYVQGILRTSADVLGVQIKFQERTPREQIPRITDVKRIPKLKTKEIEAGDANMRVKVKEYLSGILDKVEDKMQISIKRPSEYEKMKQEKQAASQLPCETSVEEIIDNKLHYHSKRNVVRLYLCKIVEDAAEQCQVNVKFPPQYQSFVKRLHRPRRRKIPSDKGASKNRASETTDQHSVVLRAITSGTVVLETAQKETSMMIINESIAKEAQRTFLAIENMNNKYDRVRAERLFHENLVMIATRTVIQALHEAVKLVHAQRRNSDFFMSDMPNLKLKKSSGTSPKEKAVLLKRQRSKHRRESLKNDNIEKVPREVDFLRRISEKKRSGCADKKGGKHISFQSTSRTNKQNEKKITKTDNSRKKTGSENTLPAKPGKGTGSKKGDEKKSGTSGKPHEKVDKEANSSVTVSVKISVEKGTGAIAHVDVSDEVVEVEPRIKEIENEEDEDRKQPGDEGNGTQDEKQQSEVKCTAVSEPNLGDKLGDDGIEAAVSTLSMKSPSLPQVTPQPSGFGLPSDSVRSGAVPPCTDTTCDDERLTAGSPSSAIFRMISMRETRERCDLSPEASYVVLPTLTSSEGTLINTRMEQVFNNDEAKPKGLESTSSLPALSRSSSTKETHSDTGAAADHVNEPVKLPSVTSVESCPSRSPTPVRSSPSQTSQVALPQIGGSNTSLVGGHDPVSMNDTKPESKPNDPPRSTGVKTPPIVTTPSKTTVAPKGAAKPVTPPKNPPGQKLQQGRPPARTKSEIPRKTTAAPALTPRKGGQARSTTVIATQKVATPNPPTQPRKPVEQRKSVQAITDRLAKSKSTGEAIVAARKNSLGGSQTTRRPSEVTVRRGSIADPSIAAKSTTSTSSNTSVKATLPKTESSVQQLIKKTDISQKSDTSNVPAADSSEPVSRKSSQDLKTKPTPDVHAKPTQKVHEESTQDSNAQDSNAQSTNHAKTTQDDSSKTASSGASKKNTKGKGSGKKTAQKSKPDKNDHKNDLQTEKDNVSEGTNLKELEADSTSLPEEITPNPEALDSTDDPEAQDTIAGSTESMSPSKFSPELTPESSPTPKAVSTISQEEFIEKPQAMVGAIVTSPDLQELTRVDSPKERRRANSISCKILSTTESDTDFYRREHAYRKLENTSDDRLVDEILEDEIAGKKRRYVSGLKPTLPKGKKKIMMNDDEDEDEMKTDYGKAKNEDAARKVSDSKTKVSDSTKNAVPNKPDNGDSAVSKTSINKARRESLSEDMKIGNRSRSTSKTSSIQALSKSSQGTISKSRRSSRSVSFSSTPHQLRDAQKQEEGKESVENLTKRRSSQKVSKKASNKDLKRRRSSVSGQQAKGKTKPSAAITAKVDSGRSKSHKTQKKSSKGTVVVSKTKPEGKIEPEDVQETREGDAQGKNVKNSKETRVDGSREVGQDKSQGTRVGKSQDTLVEKSQVTHVDDSQEARVDESQGTRVDKSQETHMDNSQEKRLDDTQGTRVGESQKTRVDSSQGTGTDESHETQVKDSQEKHKHVEDSQETRVEDSHETRAEDSQETRVEDSHETRVEDSQKARGSDDNLKKSESDLEVVVQVHVPDDGKADDPDHVAKRTSPELRKKKTAHAETKRRKEMSAQIVKEPKEPPNVTKIDLQFGLDSPDVRKTSSRRGFGEMSERSLVNMVPRNSLDMIKGVRLNPSENKGFPSRSFHSKTNVSRSPLKGAARGSNRNASDSKGIKVSNFELPDNHQAGVGLKATGHNKAQMSAHRLASKMSTNLEKVDEISALETSTLPSEESTKLTTALNISKAGVATKSTPDPEAENQEEKADNQNEKVDEGGEIKMNEKTEPSSNKSLQLLMQATNVSIDPGSFADVVKGTPLLSKESGTNNDDVIGHTSSASIKSNSSQPLVPSPPVTAKPGVVSPRISRMMSRQRSNGSGNSRGSHSSANEMSPTVSMEVVKLASNSSHGWVSSPTSSVKFLPPIDARASKASNASDESSTKKRPRTAESAVSRTGSVESRTSSGSQTKAAVVEVRRSGSGDLRIDGSSSALIGVKSSSSSGSRKQTVVGF